MRRFFFSIGSVLLLLLAVSCSGQKDKQADQTKPGKRTPPVKIQEEAQPPEVHVQRPSLGATEEELSEARTLSVYEETIGMRPPFYQGSMPLVLKAGKILYVMNKMITVYHEFDGWRNAFIYNEPTSRFSGIADGARTTDRFGRVLAEAKRTQIIKGEGIEIEEFHYAPDGKVRFYCKSRIDFVIGFKSDETDVQGEKERDYYFIWPVSSF